MGKLWRRLHFLLNRRRLARELADEMEAHRSMLPPDRQAAFGNLVRLREESRDIWVWNWLEQFWQDVAYGSRVLLHAPAFTLGAVAVLALGVGVNLAEFQIFDAVAFHRIDVHDASSLLQITRVSKQGVRLGFPSGAVNFYRTQSHSFEWLLSEDLTLHVAVEGDTDLRANFVASDYFSTLGIVPAWGRLPDKLDSQPGAPAVAALGYGYWQSHWGADPHVVGRLVHVNNKPVRIVGVSPYTFDGLSPQRTDVWLPEALRPILTETGPPVQQDFSRAGDALFGKLKPGIFQAVGDGELSGLTRELIRTQPRAFHPDERVRAQFLQESMNRRLRQSPAFAIFVVMVLLVLLSACANLGNMILARGLSRQREIDIRLAVGASPARLVRQLMTENLILAVLGAAAGLGFGTTASHILFTALDAPPGIRLKLGLPILLAALILTLLSAIVFGLPSALQIVKRNFRKSRLRQILVGVQVAVSCLLLIASGVLAHNGILAASIDTAFDYRNMVSVDPQLYARKLPAAAVRNHLDTLMARISALPGVDGVTSADVPPLGGRISLITLPGQPPIYRNMVASNYFDVMNLAVVRGRTFRMGEPDQVVVSESAARAIWPNEDPVGKIWNLQGVDRTVAGVVRDSGANLFGANLFGEPDSVEAYLPFQPAAEERAVLIVHTRGDPAQLSRAIAAAAGTMNEVVAVSLMSASRDSFLQGQRRMITLIGSLGFVATSLAAAGMFALVAFAVAQRKRELGIRIAIGAGPRHILRILLEENIMPTLAGLVAGVLLAVALERIVRTQAILRTNSVVDIPGFATGIACFLLIAALASLTPAMRALRIDPSETLREE
jgi:predicted permease